MTTLPDLLHVVLFAVVLPLLDYCILWPVFKRRSQANPSQARMRLWTEAICLLWALVAIGSLLWAGHDRHWTTLGFAVPDGWRLWTSTVLFALAAAYYASAVTGVASNADARAGVRQQFGELGAMMPHTRTELAWFGAASLSAGFCEEFLFRGYFIWALSPWLGWWGAAALSVAAFAVAHVYQGKKGILVTGIVGVFFTLLVAIFDSLWPAIAMHALIDLGSGMIAWVALRENQALGSRA